MTIVLDSGAAGYLAERSPYAAAVLRRLRRYNAWPPVVPTVVMVECLTGHAARDAPVHRVLNECDIRECVPIRLARRAAYLRTRARRGSAVDAIVVATAEPAGIAVTGDRHDFEALAGSSPDVLVEVV